MVKSSGLGMEKKGHGKKWIMYYIQLTSLIMDFLKPNKILSVSYALYVGWYFPKTDYR